MPRLRYVKAMFGVWEVTADRWNGTTLVADWVASGPVEMMELASGRQVRVPQDEGGLAIRSLLSPHSRAPEGA